MTLLEILTHFLNTAVGYVFWAPRTILIEVASLLPTCDAWGVTRFGSDVMSQMSGVIKFAWPVLKWLPWTDIWNMAGVMLLYTFVKWMYGHLNDLIRFFAAFWWIFVVLFVVGGAFDFFTSDFWMQNQIFQDTMGVTPTSTAWTGNATDTNPGRWYRYFFGN